MEASNESMVRVLGTASGSGAQTDYRSVKLAKGFERKRIITYDFKRPDKFSKEQIRTFAIIHETFSRLTTTSLSATIRLLSEVRVAEVDQMTYEEFMTSIPSPCTLAILDMNPLLGRALIQIDPAINFALIDRLFGGDGNGASMGRELSDFEASVMEGIVIRLLGNLREAWAQVIDLKPKLYGIETNPMFAQINPPHEMIILVSLDVKVGETKGKMNLVFPYLTIEPILHRFSAAYWYSSTRKGGKEPNALVSSVGTDIEVFFEGQALSLNELSQLKPGSLVALDGYAEGRAYLASGGTVLASLVARRDKNGKAIGYELAERKVSTEWASRELGDKPRAEEIDGRVAKAIEPIRSEMTEGLKAIEAKVSGGFAMLQQKQNEMADQLAFSPSADALPEPKRYAGSNRPLGFTAAVAASDIFTAIQREHPQLIALILSYLDTQKASAIFGELAPDLQPGVARRIAGMDRVAPEVLREIERILEKKLSALVTASATSSGGVESLVEMLSMVSRSTERNVVDALEKSAPVIAEEIKNHMFVFEDIMTLDDKAIAKIVSRADSELLLRAIKAAPEELKGKILGSLSNAESEGLKLRFESMGRIRLSEVEIAQQKIVSLIREMGESGEIVVARPEDSAD